MKKYVKLFIVYFPVILVAAQVAADILGVFNEAFYNRIGLYLSITLGTNLLFALFLVAFTCYFNFCKISRAAAFAELLFAINYMVVQEDNLYNILFQIIVGAIAIFITAMVYMHRFPDCTISLAKDFFKCWINRRGDCEKAIDDWEDDRIKKTRKMLYERHSRNYR